MVEDCDIDMDHHCIVCELDISELPKGSMGEYRTTSVYLICYSSKLLKPKPCCQLEHLKIVSWFKSQ